MKYAHIFQASGKNKSFELIITASPSLAGGVISKAVYASKKEAKAAAKSIGAKAWNY